MRTVWLLNLMSPRRASRRHRSGRADEARHDLDRDHHLGVRFHTEPDAGAVTAGIDDAVRADSQLTVGKPDIEPPVVPGSEAFEGGSSTYTRAASRSG
jgi:hypothetical protein